MSRRNTNYCTMQPGLYARLALLVGSSISSHFAYTAPNAPPRTDEQDKYNKQPATSFGERGFTAVHAASCLQVTISSPLHILPCSPIAVWASLGLRPCCQCYQPNSPALISRCAYHPEACSVGVGRDEHWFGASSRSRRHSAYVRGYTPTCGILPLPRPMVYLPTRNQGRPQARNRRSIFYRTTPKLYRSLALQRWRRYKPPGSRLSVHRAGSVDESHWLCSRVVPAGLYPVHWLGHRIEGAKGGHSAQERVSVSVACLGGRHTVPSGSLHLLKHCSHVG